MLPRATLHFDILMALPFDNHTSQREWPTDTCCLTLPDVAGVRACGRAVAVGAAGAAGAACYDWPPGIGFHQSRSNLPSDPCVRRRVVTFAHMGNQTHDGAGVHTRSRESGRESVASAALEPCSEEEEEEWVTLELSGDRFLCEQVRIVAGWTP